MLIEKNQIYTAKGVLISFKAKAAKFSFEVIGLSISSRGTISKFIMGFRHRFNRNQIKSYKILS
jgi:hypothetical protein